MSTRDWAALAELLSADIFTDDRRRVVNGGARHGRDAEIADKRVLADLGMTNVTVTVMATRGERLALNRVGSSEFQTEVFNVAEIDADDRIVAIVGFDLDDIDAAFEELDARYLAGEAAAHARTWSVITRVYTALNRHEIFAATPDWVTVDHRPVQRIGAEDVRAYLRATWDVTPDIKFRIEEVHGLSSLGVVVTRVSTGSSQEGFDAEWRQIDILTVDGDVLSRVEVFDEADLDAALARFDELNGAAHQLENAATRARAFLADALNRRDLDGILPLAAADCRYEDRRKMLHDEGPAGPEFVRTWFDAARGMLLETVPVAIRGPRLALTRDTYRESDTNRAVAAEHLTITDVNDDGLVRNSVFFDLDDINGATRDLTARWIASGEVAHPEVIEAARRMNEIVNRHDWEALTTLSGDATFVNHRQLSSPGVETIAGHMTSIETTASLVPDYWVELAEILVHSASGVVAHSVLKGTSAEGFAIELPIIALLLLDGERVTHFENFDANQREMALARFEELSQSG